MAILAGLLILQCAGVMVGHGYHMIRHKETPKKESEQVMMHQGHDHGQAAATSPEGISDGQADKTLNQETTKGTHPEP